MTREEALQLAAEEIQRKEQHDFAVKELSSKINQNTAETVKAQRDQKLKELQEHQEAYIKIYKKENPMITQEINEILGRVDLETKKNKANDNLMLQLELKEKVEFYRQKFEDAAQFNLFNRGVKEFGREVFIPEFEKNENNVFTTLMSLYGLETMEQLHEKIIIENQERKQKEKEFENIIHPDKDREMIEKIAQRVAEILKGQK